jgi:hypothetical protein
MSREWLASRSQPSDGHDTSTRTRNSIISLRIPPVGAGPRRPGAGQQRCQRAARSPKLPRLSISSTRIPFGSIM